MKTPKIISKVQALVEKCGKQKAMYHLRIGEHALNSLIHYAPGNLLNTGILRSMYMYFNLALDDFYYSHFQDLPTMKRHEGIVGNIFRAKRIRLGYTIADVARSLKVDDKTIERLERGVQLPTVSSYTIIRLMNLYEFSETEKQTITWLIVLLHDAMRVFRQELQNL